MSNKRQREGAIRFRVSPQEGELIQAGADESGLPLATFARDAVLKAVNPSHTQGNKASAVALRTIAADINRIAVVARKRAVSADDADRVIDELRRVQRLVFYLYYGPRAR